jgi:hypothetical protein
VHSRGGAPAVCSRTPRGFPRGGSLRLPDLDPYPDSARPAGPLAPYPLGRFWSPLYSPLYTSYGSILSPGDAPAPAVPATMARANRSSNHARARARQCRTRYDAAHRHPWALGCGARWFSDLVDPIQGVRHVCRLCHGIEGDAVLPFAPGCSSRCASQHQQLVWRANGYAMRLVSVTSGSRRSRTDGGGEVLESQAGSGGDLTEMGGAPSVGA